MASENILSNLFSGGKLKVNEQTSSTKSNMKKYKCATHQRQEFCRTLGKFISKLLVKTRQVLKIYFKIVLS